MVDMHTRVVVICFDSALKFFFRLKIRCFRLDILDIRFKERAI